MACVPSIPPAVVCLGQPPLDPRLLRLPGWWLCWPPAFLQPRVSVSGHQHQHQHQAESQGAGRRQCWELWRPGEPGPLSLKRLEPFTPSEEP